MTLDSKIMIPLLRKHIPKLIAQEIAGVQPVNIPINIQTKVPETWQRYLRRLGNGINGISDRSETVTDADIVARAEKYMQIRYPGPYRVEQYYNTQRMMLDLRLRFDDPREQTLWLLRWS